MFDLKYYNKTLHKIEFEKLIKSKGLIPIEDLSPLGGLCYNQETINKTKKLLNLDKNKIVFWKLINEIDKNKIKENLIKNDNENFYNIDYKNFLKSENNELLKLIDNFQKKYDNSKHSNFAYIQYNDKIAVPFDISYNVLKIPLFKLIDNDIECSICLEIDNFKYTCMYCYTIVCKKCNNLLKSECSICKKIIKIDEF